MAKIKRSDLTQELVKSLYDYQPSGRLSRKNSTRGGASGKIVGCMNPDGYRQIAVGDCLTVLEHRLIFFWHHGWWPKQIDHINMKRDDNRIENLRPANPSTNQMNVNVRCFTKSGLKGVHWDESRGKWMARIKINGKHVFLGRFDSKEEAYEQRKKFQHIHGEYGRI